MKRSKPELNRLLNEGIRLGVASGRGGSVYDQLKNSIDERHWEQVVVGLYNGARVVKLSESLPESLGDGPKAMRSARSRLRRLQTVLGFELVARPHQISLRPITGQGPIRIANRDDRASRRSGRYRSSCVPPIQWTSFPQAHPRLP